MHRASQGLFPAIALIALVSLASCAVAPPASQDRELERAALQEEQAGRVTQAAALWERAASVAGPGRSHALMLQAAEAWAAAGQWDRASAALDSIDDARLGGPAMSRYALLRSEQALVNADADAAAFFLALAREGLAQDQLDRYLAIEESIVRMRFDPASRVLAQIERRLATLEPRDDGAIAELLRELETVSSGELERAVLQDPEHPAAAWADLAGRIRGALVSGQDPAQSALEWTAAHPDHVISADRYQALLERYAGGFRTPRSVAVLLPESGSLAGASAAIRDGLMSAYFERPDGANLRLYSTGANATDALRAHEEALFGGAHWIVGPLDRDAVEAVVTQAHASVPTLLLNEFDARPNGGGTAPEVGAPLYALSLSQENEARVVAQHMLDSGIRNVIVLGADSPWGRRMERAFFDAFSANGGRVLESAELSARDGDHSEQLKRLLSIDRSEQRKDALQRTLGLSLAFEPHVRDDLDAFFLSTTAEQARQLRPQLRFYEAGRIPVYATGRVFSGAIDETLDRDLDGITFPLTPAQMEAAQGQPLPGLESLRDGRALSLFALGQDAWGVLRWLPLLEKDPDLAYPGRSGSLRVSPDGGIERRPVWAQFENGRPRPASEPEAK